MYKVKLFGGDNSETTERLVNEWLANTVTQKLYIIIDVHYSYSGGYHGVMFRYTERNGSR